MSEYKLSYTASEIDTKLGEIDTIKAEIIDLKTNGTSQTPLFANSIEECTDTTKLYVLPDGYIYAYITKEITHEVPNCNNLFVVSECAMDCRVSSNGSLKSDSGSIGGCVSGFISVEPNKSYVLRSYPGFSNIAEYSAIPTDVSIGVVPDTHIRVYEASGHSWEDPKGSAKVATITTGDNVHFIRIGIYATTIVTIPDGVYITLDEPITLGTTTVTEPVTGWMSTGHTFTSEDYGEKINDLENRVSSLESGSEDGLIPQYWLEALENGADEIRKAIEVAGRNKSSFLFYSDAHWTDNVKISPRLLKWLYNHTPINKTIFGGDIAAAEPEDENVDDRIEMSYLWEWRSMVRDVPNHHSVAGNHDDGNKTNNLFPSTYVYAYLFASEESNDIVHGDDTYYYIDDKCEKTRYIYLDTGYKDISNLSNEQRNFLTNSLSDTPSGWHIIIISHIWYVPDYDQYSERPVPLTGLSSAATSVVEILDNYNATREESDAKIEFCIGGHIHYDYVDKTEGGIPIICCETDSTQIRGEYAYSANTIAEAAVSGIIANYSNNTVTVVRVGRGNSFVIDMDNPSLETYYKITMNLTNITSSNDVSQIKKGEVFSTTLTATTGEITSVIIKMGNTDITDSVYGHDTGLVTIPSVTGNIVITAIAQSNEPSYTNVLDTVGYTEGYRLSGSSGEPKENAGTDISGFIPMTAGDYLYLKNVAWVPNMTDYTGFIGVYLADKSYKTGYNLSDTHIQNNSGEIDENGYITKIRIYHEDMAYVRISAQNIDETSIITVNQPID